MMARTISDREARARAFTLVDEIQTRAQKFEREGMDPESAIHAAMEEMAE
ncbi:hypothetical protein vBCbaSRXM_19 [Citromicrobium phage vB_CbaS-RXM]|nr:hypothetical protein vBCbaSRXM_19 [Citromicrobium phage vB_CbaS-RXM]